jgi:hypothetical protein
MSVLDRLEVEFRNSGLRHDLFQLQAAPQPFVADDFTNGNCGGIRKHHITAPPASRAQPEFRNVFASFPLDPVARGTAR